MQQEGANANARELFKESLSMFRELKDKRHIISSLNGMANLAYVEGDIEGAKQLYEECLTLTRDFGDRDLMSAILSNLGFVAKAQSDYSKAQHLFEESLMISYELQDKWGVAAILTGFAGIKFIEGEVMKSAQLQGVVMALLEQIDAQLGSYEDLEYDKTTSALKAQLGEAVYEEVWEKGKMLSIEQAVRIALEKDN
jgi:tetratricopeptide (TPR) repeat protein